MRLVRYTYPTAGQTLGSRYGSSGPYSGLESEINRLFESAFSEFTAPVASGFAVDLYEDKDNLYVRAELPGVERSAISVEVVNDQLNLTAARKNQEGEEERSVSFSRSVTVPESVQADKVTAQYQDGLLTVTLPKKEEAKPRKIAVSVN